MERPEGFHAYQRFEINQRRKSAGVTVERFYGEFWCGAKIVYFFTKKKKKKYL